MKNRKKSEVEKSKVLSNSKSFDIFETNSSRKSIPNQPTKITFHPVLIENKVNKRQSLIANKDSQGVYIPKSDKPKRTIGPLVDGMIVQQNSLGHLIRKSILNYSLDKITVYSRSISQRKKIIKTLCTNYQNNSTLSDFVFISCF
ncbi:hypothetical protein LY90DRAFT_501983 [Neocallimastix californiae]|uniref:Uncharacterized protein n=1 Tax=Neocallimastix californiae TaxID=1754190 RepID=A0A1Y2EW99_9FUNG|nr:hypothetical protein LY90DRAFT_501983 [Neocallimastix californiae]|eukprot:ORY75873.1 hypothetical protein LY90DRAFT_501983 [Neocallimastix californiae]